MLIRPTRASATSAATAQDMRSTNILPASVRGYVAHKRCNSQEIDTAGSGKTRDGGSHVRGGGSEIPRNSPQFNPW